MNVFVTLPLQPVRRAGPLPSHKRGHKSRKFLLSNVPFRKDPLGATLDRCQTEVLKVSLSCCVKPASPHRTFAIICYKSPVDRCHGMQFGCCIDLHELAISRTFWHKPSLPGQIRIPSLAPFYFPQYQPLTKVVFLVRGFSRQFLDNSEPVFGTTPSKERL